MPNKAKIMRLMLRAIPEETRGGNRNAPILYPPRNDLFHDETP